MGEIWHPAPEWTAGGTRFDGVMNYVLTEAILRFAAGGRVDPHVVAPVSLTLQPALDAAGYGQAIDRLLATYPEASHRANLNLLGSHDTPRVLSMVGEDRDSVVLSALLLFTFIGAPCIYYGDEVGMRGHHDPGARGAFPWEYPGDWDREILEAFRSLAALRREHPALRRGDLSASGGCRGPVCLLPGVRRGDRGGGGQHGWGDRCGDSRFAACGISGGGALLGPGERRAGGNEPEPDAAGKVGRGLDPRDEPRPGVEVADRVSQDRVEGWGLGLDRESRVGGVVRAAARRRRRMTGPGPADGSWRGGGRAGRASCGCWSTAGATTWNSAGTWRCGCPWATCCGSGSG